MLFFFYIFNIIIPLFFCLQYFEFADSSYITYPLHYLFCIYVKYPTLNKIKSSFEEDKKSLILFHDMHLKENVSMCKKIVKNNAGLYIWFNTLNSKFYTGRALHLNDRPFSHITTNKGSKPLTNAINKHGLNVFVLVICIIEKHDANFLSKRNDIIRNLIQVEDRYLATFMKRFFLYNILDRNLSDVYSPLIKTRELNPFYGKKHTEALKKN